MAFSHVMRSAISLNGSFFNAQRMVMQYLQNAYSLSTVDVAQREAAGEPPPAGQ